MTILPSNILLKPDPEKVTRVYWLSITDAIRLHIGATDEVKVPAEYVNALTEDWVRSTRTFKREKFLPRIQQYDIVAHIMGEKLLENRFPLGIS